MGRPWREEYKGGIYHVIARGNNKEYIFKESIDKGYFVKSLKEYGDSMGYQIYGYVLMDNHYHLIIQTFDKKLQEIMHQINNRYSKYFNNKYTRVGHVFQGRYKAAFVQDERYMVQLLRYIHQNPIKARMCNTIEAYKWSSDVYYRRNIKGFVNIDTILEMFDNKIEEAIVKYKAYMKEEEAAEFDTMKVIGDDAYQILCSSRKTIMQRKRLDEILIETGASIEIFNQIKAGSRKRNLTEYKLNYAKVALELHYTYREIGENIGMTDSAIKDMISRYTRKLYN